MSVPVLLPELRARIEEFGDVAFLVTVGEDGAAHVVSVAVRIDDDRLVTECGRHTRANLATNPAATLVWAPVTDGEYSLIVDGDATVVDGERVGVTPTRAVLHRSAGATDDAPGCVPIVAE